MEISIMRQKTQKEPKRNSGAKKYNIQKFKTLSEALNGRAELAEKKESVNSKTG